MESIGPTGVQLQNWNHKWTFVIKGVSQQAAPQDISDVMNVA